MERKLSKNGATFIRLHEGFRPNWYLDPVGIPTIGVGFTWRSASFKKWWKKNRPGVKFERGVSITRSEADDALQFLVKHEYGKAVNVFLGDKKIPQHVFDGMVSPVFNLGPGSLKWKWAAAITRGDYKESARLLRKTGVTARGVRLNGLVRRRKEEALLISDGIYTGVLKTRLPTRPVDAMADGKLVRREAGPEVAALIKKLHMLGEYDGVLDDIFGYGTEAAVVSFQRKHGLKPTGEADAETLTAIDKALKIFSTSGKGSGSTSTKAVVGGVAVVTVAVVGWWEQITTWIGELF